MKKNLTNALLVLVLLNVAGCNQATRSPDFQAPTNNLSSSEYNSSTFVASKTWVEQLNLTNKPTNFLQITKAEENVALMENNPIVLMLDENMQDSSFSFNRKQNNQTYGLQKITTDAQGNLNGVLMGDKGENSSDFDTFANTRLKKISNHLASLEGDLPDVGVAYGKTELVWDIESPEAFVSKNASAGFVVRDPIATNWHFQTFAYFKQNEKLGFQSLGIKTPASQLPKQGLARYLGLVNGIYKDTKKNKQYYVYANIQIWVSFDQAKALFNLDSKFNSTDVKVYDIQEVHGKQKLVPINLTWDADNNYSYENFAEQQLHLFATGTNFAELDFVNSNISYDFWQNLAEVEILLDKTTIKHQNQRLQNGKIRASFYGTKAAEIGGVFELHNQTEGIIFMGAFGTKRD